MTSPATTQRPRGEKNARVRYSNRVKVLLCYAVSFAMPPLWLVGSLLLVYPYRLVGSAPAIAQNLGNAFPFLQGVLGPATLLAQSPANPSASALAAALNRRDQQWMLFLCLALALAWLVTLLCQLIWRWTHARGYRAAAYTARAIRDYRASMLVIWLVNLAAAAAVWLLGVRFIQGRTIWDYLVYLVPYALNGLAALCCFRLAAPPALSGRRAFFKRL